MTVPAPPPPPPPPRSDGDGTRLLGSPLAPYDGPREVPGGAIRAVWADSTRRALGIRRSVGAKVIPIGTLVLTFIPAVVFVGLAALLPDNLVTEGILPSYADYYGFVTSAVVLFAAVVAPEVLTRDRREGLVGYYLAGPLTRVTYLATKAAAVGAVLATATVGPSLLMLVAFTLEGSGPPGPADVVVLAARIAGAGLAVAAFFTAVSMAASALTDRRAAASAGVLAVLVGSTIVVGTLVESLGWSPGLVGLSGLAGPAELVQRIFGETSEGRTATAATWAVVAGQVAWIGASVAAVGWRYRRLDPAR